MYDSISSTLIRLIRRHWVFVVLMLCAGAGIASLQAVRGGNWSSSRVFDVSQTSNVAGQLQLGNTAEIDIRRVAIRANQRYEHEDLSDSIAVSAVADSVAGSVSIEATGSSEAATREAVALYSDFLAEETVNPKLVESKIAVASQTSRLAKLYDRLDVLDQQLQDLQPSEPGRDLVLISRVDLRTDIAAVEAYRESLVAYQDFLQNDLIDLSSVESERATLGLTAPLTGALLGGVAVVIGLMAVALFDRRVRRRIHLERAAPLCRAIAVLPKLSPGDHASAQLVARSLAAFAQSHDCDRVLLIGLSSDAAEQQIAALATEAGADVTVDLASATPTMSEQRGLRGVTVLIAEWGRTSEQRVAATAATIRSTGTVATATVLIGVPTNELDYASVSAEGAFLATDGSILQ